MELTLYDGSQHTMSWSFDPVPVQGTYSVEVANADTAEVAASATFHIDAVHVTNSAVASTTFFPLEHDGHKDFVRFFFRTDVRARDTIRVTNRHGRVIRRIALGTLSGERVHGWKWDGRDGRGHLARPGMYGIHVTAVRGVAADAGPLRSVRIEALPVRITRRSVGPSPFFPIDRDRFRDTTTFRFRTNLRAADLIQVVTSTHRLVRNERIGTLRGRTTHAWTWDGRDGRRHRLRPGTYRIRVVASHFGQKAKSHWLRVVLRRKHHR
jgi:flagellar hook assembly protein FlgD